MRFQVSTPRLILASASSARRALLTQAGLMFEVMPAAIDEADVKASARAEGADAHGTALLLAELKARRIARRAPDAMVIGCDQLLICGDRWFDKPVDREDARAHLAALRGRSHTLVTAVVCLIGSQRVWHHVACPVLTMRAFSDRFLAEYLVQEGAALMQTVGAYRLEGAGIHLFERIEGEYGAILGLPMLPLLEYLRQHGLLEPEDLG